MKILVFSHFFYPYSLIGSKRMTSFVHYLVSRNQDVTVVKADNYYYGEKIIAEKILHEGYKVVEVKTADGSDNWLEWIKAYKRIGSELCTKEKYDCCIFSGGPFNYFVVGRYLKRKYNLPYFLDFRDVGAHKIIAPEAKVEGVYKLISFLKNYSIEAISVKKADRVILTSDVMKEFYQKRYPNSACRMYTIYNGYDEKSLENFEHSKIDKNCLSMAIFGKFSYYGNHYVEWLAQAIKALQEKGIKVELLHIGEKEKAFEETFASIEGYVNIPTATYSEGMKLLDKKWVMVISHYLQEAISTKIFDYIFINHPVLAFLPENSASEMVLRRFEHSYFGKDAKTVEDALLTIWNKKIDYLTTDIENVKLYSRQSQNEILFGYMQEIKL